MIARPVDVTDDADTREIRALLDEMVERRASDLLLVTGEVPKLRVDGRLVACASYAARLTPPAALRMIRSLMSDAQWRDFEAHQELDFSFGVSGLSRFRGNVFKQRGSIALVARSVPLSIQPIHELGLPDVVGDLTMRTRGLVLVTGSAGSGKSTTLAAMIDQINRQRSLHVVTVEDPIEFIHQNKCSTISQREVGADTESFAAALRQVLRQSPDVVLIGEMRDLDTMAAALTIAETGHLTLATLHTNSAADSINRIVDVFPANQQAQVRAQLAIVLEAVVTQCLVPRADGHGRVCATEVMLCTPAIRTAIRDNRTHQIPNIIEMSRSAGMQSMDRSLLDHVVAGRVTHDDAIKFVADPEAFERFLKAGTTGRPVMAGSGAWPGVARRQG